MFDANGVVCTDIHKATLEVLSSEEVLKMSVCRIISPKVFVGESPHVGGLHDPAMGSLDTRIPCATCGLRRDCPGHLGHIEFPLYVYHPTLISSLVRLLKMVCFHCCRLKIDERTASVFVKKFQLLKNGMLEDAEKFEFLHGHSSGGDRFQRVNKGFSKSPTHDDIEEEKRVQLIQLFLRIKETEEHRKALCQSLQGDISETHTSVEAWTSVRRKFLSMATSRFVCSHCNRVFSTNVKQSPGGVGIQLTWAWGSEKPFSRLTNLKNVSLSFLKPKETSLVEKEHIDAKENIRTNERLSLTQHGSDEDEETMIHGRRGRVIGCVEFQSYHLIQLLESLWNSPDRDVLEFLYPMSIKNSWEMFFIRYLPVSSNRFRPLSQGPAFGKGTSKVGSFGQQSTLHIRTCGLLDILTASLKLENAIKSLKEDILVEKTTDSNNLSQEIVKNGSKSRDKKRIITPKEKSTLITVYCKELQQYVNQYIDSTKTINTRGKRFTPGLRQWMERKEGAIRQKMMGKRVNFVARTVVAPDNTIQTNEIGIPLEFAMKLTIPEYVTNQSASWLQKLVENGACHYPGANRVEDCHGHVYDLAVMTDEQRLRKARLLFSNFHNEGIPHIVYRHVRDGDVVIMNRQPTLHRASIMAHFIRVLPGWKTFRLMYVNCASYNADFDGDEMNMHLPQDPTSQAEAKLILNADNQYITVKNGEPLRGLIQDHVLGGAFLTCRNTFLTKNQYYTLVYTGLSSFVDSGSCMAVEGMSSKSAWSCETTHENVIFKCFPSSSRLMCQLNGCIKIQLEPPVLWKPEQLWTGKQVITSILKTVVDTIAKLQFSKNPGFLQQYQGIHFKANSKTPGDSWGGVLDGDDEESMIIISDSELLQGVFDKSMFGASCFGLIHLIHELLGPSAAGLLLGIFAKTFTCFLQMRGFSCCVGDFLMTEKGEKKRRDMIRRCILAGNFIQEILVDTISKDMNFTPRLMPKKTCREKLQKVHQIMLKSQQDQLYFKTNQNVTCLPSSVMMSHPFPLKSTQQCLIHEEENVENNIILKRQDEDKMTLSHNSIVSKNSHHQNFWNETRESHIPFFHGNCKQRYSPSKIMETITDLIQQIFQLSSGNEKKLQELLMTLAQNKNLAIFFPHVARLVGADRLWTIQPEEYINKKPVVICTNSLKKENSKVCHSVPEPNRCCILSNGQVMMGDGALRLPQLYHPSYLYQKLDGFEFEDIERYKYSLLKNQATEQLKEYKQHDMFSLIPNELTRYRLEQLALCQFPGKENTLIKIIDGFFQTVMGKLTSTNNDLVSGKATLYKFPQNGFASMITTGAKGSKVNFAMICGMLSQQSLEGRRIPVMVSGKTLPSFGFYDFGTRAGGLITDCYLQGLRPQEYFFHCMAGREGLVDTAVKTARSGYLQRCVMKGMEGILVQYDGTVRDSDGSIIQFLYGEDGIDISKASYTKKLDDLLQNPVIIKAKFASDSKLKHAKVSKSLHSIHQWVKQTKNYSFTDSKSQWMENEKFVSIHDPISNVFPFRKYVGCSSEKYFQQVKQLIKQDPHDFLSRYMALTKNTSPPMETDHISLKKQRHEAKQTLKNLLLIKYSEGLCAPGEAVGCIAAQSMGEPATQMTLNTFHLAGHGAANVTLGIPRLREILQTAGKTKTPMVYAPVLGDTYEEAMKNADIALKGFKRIPLSDVIHAIGVESNFYCQPSKQHSKVKIEGERQDNFYWEYETTIQFENLDHFCLAIPQFTPQHVITFTLNHLVRDMAKQVNRLVYLYASSYAEEVLDSEDDELECASNRFIFDRNIRSHFTRRDLRKERARVAGVGYLKKTVGQTSSIDLMTNVDVKETMKGGTTEATTDENEFLDDTTISRENKLKEEVGDSDHSTDDSEKDFSDSEKDIEEKKEIFLVDGDETEKDEESSLSHGDSSTTGDDKDLSDKEMKSLKNEFFNQEDSRRKKEIKKKWKELQRKQYDNSMNSSKTTNDTPELLSNTIKGSVVNTSGKTIKLKPLPDDAYRFLTDIKVSRECWTIQVKFGWPYKKCPRRVVLLNDFVTMIKKYKLQDIPGITNPRIITGNQTETKVHCEVQCEGSNFGWIFGLRDTCIDHTRVTTNDIRTLLDFLGVEACRTSIIQELNKVFSVYGISVDYRHMSLIADTMTHSGYFRPFSRLGIQHHSSPLLQMSFETSMKFLTEAIQRGALDNLKTPAGAIVTGRPVLAGTGMCRILTNIDAYKKKNISKKKVRTESEQKDIETNDNATCSFKSKTKKRLTKEVSKNALKKQKFVFS